MQSSDWSFKNVPQDIGKVRLVLIKTPNFKPVYLRSICPIAMQFLSSESTFQALHLDVKI